MRIVAPRRAALGMAWRDVAFLSWKVDAGRLVAHVPPGVELDLFEGQAWLSIVPFRIESLRLGVIRMPFVAASIPEINLRTYVRVGRVPGIWFFTLDAASALLVAGARMMTGLNYLHAHLNVARDPSGTIGYRSVRDRAASGDGRFEATYAPQGPEFRAQSGSLDAFLCERYHFFVQRRNGLFIGDVFHPPWLLRALEVDVRHNSIGATVGIALPGDPDAARFGHGAIVRAGVPRRVL